MMRLDVANKLSQELRDRTKQLKSAMFNDKLASFYAFPSTDETCLLGELAFSTIKLPFNNTDLKPIDIHATYDFVLPLENGQLIVTFKVDDFNDETHISCFNRLSRPIGFDKLEWQLKRENVAQCGLNQFVMCHGSDTFKLSVYNSSLQCLRDLECKEFSSICCNSKFVFGLWNARYSYESDSDNDDEDEDEDQEQDDNESDELEDEEEYSPQRIQVCHLDTLSKAFELRVPKKCTIERIWADEHHVVAMSKLTMSYLDWYMTIFDLAKCNRHGDNRQQQAKRARKKKAAAGVFFLAEKHVLLNLDRRFYDSEFLSKVSLFDGCLVALRVYTNEILWFNKNGTRSEMSTRLDNTNLKELYASGSIIILTSKDGKLYFQR